ncbi:MAG: glycogen/starch synthase [Candidatus Thiodiazotropha sp.]
MTQVLMVAAENDALPGGKVGGIGDVVRDVAPALAEHDIKVSVLTPAYGVFTDLPGAERLGAVRPWFAGKAERVDLFEVPGRVRYEGVRHLVLENPQFNPCGDGRIYCNDPPGRPYATDATKFALFCAAVAEMLRKGVLGAVDVLHLHDWHAALVATLIEHDVAFQSMRELRCVYSVHNLALQGIRPFSGDVSSFTSWFPDLRLAYRDLVDPRWPDCVNLMAVGIRLADAVHVVSPSYAEDVQLPSAAASAGFHGGEGLESDLVTARKQGRLFGVLNGCEYPQTDGGANSSSWKVLRALMAKEILRWAGQETTLSSAHFIASKRVERLTPKRPGILVTSVSRITDQKIRLLREPASGGRPTLELLLERLGEKGFFVFLGSGDPALEQFLIETAARYEQFMFLRGYSDDLARAIYATGDLFLMPSSFEPCGIGQMLAMREGQPCLVHHVGGLRDTIEDGKTGFAFTGDGLREQADALVARFESVLAMHEGEPERYAAIRAAARAERFEWSTSVIRYLRELYGLDYTGASQ